MGFSLDCGTVPNRVVLALCGRSVKMHGSGATDNSLTGIPLCTAPKRRTRSTDDRGVLPRVLAARSARGDPAAAAARRALAPADAGGRDARGGGARCRPALGAPGRRRVGGLPPAPHRRDDRPAPDLRPRIDARRGAALLSPRRGGPRPPAGG